MTETFGTLVFPKAAIFSHINRENSYLMKQELVEGLFNPIKQDIGQIKTDMFCINDVRVRDDYIGITASGYEWQGLVQQLYESSLCAEIYAALFTEYGGNFFYAKNAGEKHHYLYDEEGDDQFQAGFDANKYTQKYEEHKLKWHAIANPFVVTNFKPVVAFNPCNDTRENQSLAEVYTKQQFSTMMQKQLPEMIDLLTTATEDSISELIKKYLARNERKFRKLSKSFTDLHREVILICFTHMVGKEPVKVEDETRIYYKTPLKELGHIDSKMPKRLGFDWLEERHVFSLDM